MAEPKTVRAKTTKPKPKPKLTKPKAKPAPKSAGAKLRNLKPENVESVTLYHDECYSCHSRKYQRLYSWIIDARIALAAYIQKRAPLNKEWQDEAKAIIEANHGLKKPFVAVKPRDDEIIALNIEDFYKELGL